MFARGVPIRLRPFNGSQGGGSRSGVRLTDLSGNGHYPLRGIDSSRLTLCTSPCSVSPSAFPSVSPLVRRPARRQYGQSDCWGTPYRPCHPTREECNAGGFMGTSYIHNSWRVKTLEFRGKEGPLNRHVIFQPDTIQERCETDSNPPANVPPVLAGIPEFLGLRALPTVRLGTPRAAILVCPRTTKRYPWAIPRALFRRKGSLHHSHFAWATRGTRH